MHVGGVGASVVLKSTELTSLSSCAVFSSLSVNNLLLCENDLSPHTLSIVLVEYSGGLEVSQLCSVCLAGGPEEEFRSFNCLASLRSTVFNLLTKRSVIHATWYKD